MKDDGWVKTGFEVSASRPGESRPTKRREQKNKSVPSKRIARTEFLEGNYKIVACQWQGQYVANAHAGGRRIEQVTGDSIDAALVTLKKRLQERTLKLQACRKGTVPCIEEYRDALESYVANLSGGPLATALRIHAAQPERTASFQQLSFRLRISSKELERAYAKLGCAIGKGLSFQPSAAVHNVRSILAFATVSEGTLPGAGIWTLRLEFTEALRTVVTP